MIASLLAAVSATLLVGACCIVLTSWVAKHSLRWASLLGPASVALAIGAGLAVGVQQMLVDSKLPLFVLASTAPIALLVGMFLANQTQQQVAETSAALEKERSRREIEQTRRELIAWMSHDIRTPLAGIRAMGEALEDAVAPDPAAYISSIVSATKRASSMVDDLMALAALSSGSLDLAKEPVSMGDVLSDLAAQLAELAAQRGVTVKGQVIGVTEVNGDPRLLARAVQNALVNAVNYTDAGSSVSARAWSSEKHVIVEIRDQCGGISPEELPRLFEAGWRGDSARTPSAAVGSGLGLPIVRNIVEAHDGKVNIENADGGCLLTIFLPLP